MGEKKSNIFIFIKILIYVVLVTIPIIMYYFIGIPLPIKSATNKDWLSFWGSIFGGCIGGGATLIGVLLTINHVKIQQQREDKEKEKLNRPKLVPLKMNYYLYRDEESVLFAQYTQDIKKEEIGKEIYFQIINTGIENAINCVVNYITPGYDLLSIDIESGILTDVEVNMIKDCCNKDKVFAELPFIKSSSTGECTTIPVSNEFRILLVNIIRSSFLKNEESMLNKKINMGTIEFKYNDITMQNEYKDRYNIILTIKNKKNINLKFNVGGIENLNSSYQLELTLIQV